MCFSVLRSQKLAFIFTKDIFDIRVCPSYVVNELCKVADVEARQRLRSASSSSLIVSRTRLSTVRDRAFPVAAARIWNSLHQHVISAPSLLVFRSRLKTRLFTIFYQRVSIASYASAGIARAEMSVRPSHSGIVSKRRKLAS